MNSSVFLGLLERVLNRLLQADPDASVRLAPLSDRTIRVDTFLFSDHSLFLSFTGDGLRLDRDFDGEPDAVISGGPAGLTRSALNPGDRGVFGDGTLRVSGDVSLVQSFSELVSHYHPDWQTRLQGLVGEAVTARVENAAEALDRWRTDALHKAVTDGGEYLREERRLAMGSESISRFADAVDDLSADLARLEQRIERLESPGDDH